MNLLCILSSLMVLKGLSDPDPIKQFNESMTHYDYLEVDKYANIGEIKKNYRTLALKFHPDKISQMSSNFSEVELENLRLLFLRIQEAYEVLSDPELRIQYDLQQTDPEFYGDHFHMNNDVINEFNKYTQMPYHLFGKYSKYVRAHFYAEFNRPAIPELKGVVKVPIKYIFTGYKGTHTFYRKRICPKCKGLGTKSKQCAICPECAGSGRSNQLFESIQGKYGKPHYQHVSNTLCNSCKGKGCLVVKPHTSDANGADTHRDNDSDVCDMCHGAGSHMEQVIVAFDLPINFQDKFEFTYRQEGHQDCAFVYGAHVNYNNHGHGRRIGDASLVIEYDIPENFKIAENGNVEYNLVVPISELIQATSLPKKSKRRSQSHRTSESNQELNAEKTDADDRDRFVNHTELEMEVGLAQNELVLNQSDLTGARPNASTTALHSHEGVNISLDAEILNGTLYSDVGVDGNATWDYMGRDGADAMSPLNTEGRVDPEFGREDGPEPMHDTFHMNSNAGQSKKKSFSRVIRSPAGEAVKIELGSKHKITIEESIDGIQIVKPGLGLIQSLTTYSHDEIILRKKCKNYFNQENVSEGVAVNPLSNEKTSSEHIEIDALELDSFLSKCEEVKVTKDSINTNQEFIEGSLTDSDTNPRNSESEAKQTEEEIEFRRQFDSFKEQYRIARGDMIINIRSSWDEITRSTWIDMLESSGINPYDEGIQKLTSFLFPIYTKKSKLDQSKSKGMYTVDPADISLS